MPLLSRVVSRGSARMFVSAALALAALVVALGDVGAQDCLVPSTAPGAVVFAPDVNLAMRQRKPVGQLTPAEVARLRLAYQKLRELSQTDPADPRGWRQQARIHDCYCGVGDEIHRSFFFLPWHRAFLYYHERILGKLIGDMSFALPAWDWDTPGPLTLPAIYAAAAPNSLLHANRGITVVAPLLRPSTSDDARVALAQRTADAFLGADWVPVARTAGVLEMGPHNAIHNWVGLDMASSRVAALDPVFYAHHTNVDRLWTKWLAQGGGRGNHASTTFLNMSWEFFDENKVLVRIKAQDVLNHETSLRYRYDVQLPATVPSSPAPTTTMTIPVEAAAPPHKLAITPKTYTVTPDVVQLAALLGARPELGFTVYLEVEGLDFQPAASTMVNVFWGKPDATALTAESDPAYVGRISNFPAPGDAQHAHRKSDALFEVTDKANTLPLLGAQVTITLVPIGVHAVPPLVVPFTYDAIRLRIVRREL